jgi:hypothetical protein
VATARETQFVEGSVHEAESCWYDTARWPAWVDELQRVTSVEGDWPRPGSVVRWESGPAGRGRVSERVVEYAPLEGQTLEVEDDAIEARQWVSFSPAGQGVEVELILDYRIKRRSPVTPLVDLLFVRRAMAASMARTLARFAPVVAESRRSAVG